MKVEIMCDPMSHDSPLGGTLAVLELPSLTEVGEQIFFHPEYSKREELGEPVFVVRDSSWHVRHEGVVVLLIVDQDEE